MGFENPVGGRRIGAKEKRDTAQRLRDGDLAVKSKKEGPQQGHLSSVIFVLVISTVLAWFVTERSLITGPGYHPTGAPALDDFLAGSGVPDITGNGAADYWLLIVLRGIFVTLMAGLVPFFTWAFVTITDRVKGNFYITCWGVSATVLLLGYLGWDIALPAVNAVFAIIMDL